jgi:transcriptional regulator with XRE-family HTH domain
VEEIEAKVFTSKLNTPEFLSGDEFQNLLIEGMDLFNLDDEDCARLFDVSRPTITRWRNGSTAPSRVVRRLVSDVLKKQATKRLRTRRRIEKRVAAQAIAQNT